MNKLTIACLFILVFLLAGCRSSQATTSQGKKLKIPDLPEESGKTWLEIDPIQCGGNAWQGDWTKTDATVPQKCQSQCNQGADREKSTCQDNCLLRAYYSREGVEIFEIKSITYEEKVGEYIPLCLACGCPGGETIYIQTQDSAVEQMLELGFRHVVRNCDTATPQPYYCMRK